MRILLIDDRRERRKILREALGDGYETLEAESARNVRQERPDLILISLFLSGRVCLPCIEQCMAADVPVLVYADLDDEAAEAAALEAGAEDVILAPFRPVVLRRRVENILKRRRYELERQRSAVDREMRALLENLPVGVGVYRIGPDEIRHQYINHKALELFGFEREDEAALRQISSALFVDYDADAAERFRRRNTPIATNHVYQARRKDGSPFWVQSIACTLPQPDGTLLCYAALADATETERARQELEDSRNQIRSIFEHLPGAVATFEMANDHVRLTYLSDGCEKVTGYSSAEFLERCRDDMLRDVHPDDRSRLRRLTPEDARQRRTFGYTFRVRHKDGGYRWVSLSLAPYLRGGKLLYYGVYTDVSAERETELMMNQLVNALPGGVVIYRFHEKGIATEYYSDGIPRLSGHTREEYEELVRLNPIDNIVYQDDMPQMLKVVGESVATGAPISITYRIRHKSGSLVWLQLSARKIREEGGYPVYYAVFT
ncbi:MAG: PAS domain-containing protein, partial [Eubacteriales bacterium]|nr:PAS domain-containing protein [Eubacteriales bacterium]